MSQTEQKLNITPVFSADCPVNTLVIRYDEALKVYDPVAVKLEGVITTPSEYVTKRGDLVDSLKSNVVFSRDALTIELTVNETDKFKTVIKGSLQDSPFLNSLRLNSESPFQIKELRALLKKSKIHFRDPDRYKALIIQMENYRSTVQTSYEQFNNKETKEKGASIKKKISETSENFNFDFVLKTPIFVGGEPVEMPITVSIEPGDSFVELFLEYDDFELKREEEIDRVWKDQMDYFNSFVIVEKS